VHTFVSTAFAVPPFDSLFEFEVDESVYISSRLKVYVSAATAVSAVWSAHRLILFAAPRDDAVPAIAGPYFYKDVIYELTHV
jgi:hypothetical protein